MLLIFPYELFGFVIEDRDELVSDNLALLFRIGDACKLRQKPITRIHCYQVESKPVAKIGLYFLEFVFAQYAIVDKDAGQPVSHGTLHQNGRHGGIHAARKRADRVSIADRLFNRRDGLVDESLRRPVGLGMADAEDEVTQQIGAKLRVMNLRMKLHCPCLALRILDCCKRAGALRYYSKP